MNSFIQRNPYLSPSEFSKSANGTTGGAYVNVRTLYRSRSKNSLIEDITELAGVDMAGVHLTRLSSDNGCTWSLPKVLFRPEKVAEGGYLRAGESALLLSNRTGRLYRFYNQHHYPELHFTSDIWWRCKIMSAMSEDEGITFSEASPLQFEGCGAAEWAPGVIYGRNCLAISFSHPFCRSDGALIVPAQRVPMIEEEQRPIIRWQAGCLIGEESKDGIQWKAGRFLGIDPGLSVRGICEPAVAELTDGRMLMVARGSNVGVPEMKGHKWASLSEDGGETWSCPRPFPLSNGTDFFSPTSGSALIRHSNGRLYWIGNICPENPKSGRPRFPLVIAEVEEEEKIGLKTDSIRSIDTQTEQDSPQLQLSNFRAHEDRETGEIVICLARLEEAKPRDFSSPTYQYRIAMED